MEQLRLGGSGRSAAPHASRHPGGVPRCGGTLCRGRGAAPAEPGSGSQFLPDPHYHLAGIYTARQMFAQALPCAEKAFSLASWYPALIGMYAGLLVRMGQPERGQEVFKTLGSSEAYGTARGMAIFHTCCGQIDLAADWDRKGDRGTRSPCPAATAKCDRGAVTPEPALAQVGGADESFRVCGNQCALS